jgi:glycosyltransferase involved in cell wall biosynthesis
MNTSFTNQQVSVVSSIASLVPECGGPSRSTTALCSALAEAGVAVNLLSLDYGKKFRSPIIPSSEKVHTRLVPCQSSQRLRMQWAPQFKRALLDTLRGARAGLIHDNGLWAFTNHAAAQVARQRVLPLILSTRGMLSRWSLSHKTWKKWVGWHLYQCRDLRSAAAFHATSAGEAEDIRALGFRQPIAIIPNGVEIPERPAETEGRPKTALFLGRLHPVKGLLPFVEAWAKVSPPGWKMIIAGPDEDSHRAQVQLQVQAAGLAEQFEFVAAAEGEFKDKLFRAASLFVMPSHTENFGMAIAEALAYGLPVLTTKGTPWKELLSRQCGWWTDFGAEALADALTAATRLPSRELAEMGKRGRQFVEESFSWKRIGAEMRSVYQWALGFDERPSSVSCG